MAQDTVASVDNVLKAFMGHGYAVLDEEEQRRLPRLITQVLELLALGAREGMEPGEVALPKPARACDQTAIAVVFVPSLRPSLRVQLGSESAVPSAARSRL